MALAIGDMQSIGTAGWWITAEAPPPVTTVEPGDVCEPGDLLPDIDVNEDLGEIWDDLSQHIIYHRRRGG